MKAIVLNNIRSAHNVGSILRTAEFFGFDQLYFAGVTPYPALKNDTRLPHVRTKLDKQIKKVSLGAEDNLEMDHFDELSDLVKKLRAEGCKILALEQDERSVLLTGGFRIESGMIKGMTGMTKVSSKHHPKLDSESANFALLLGEETKGLTKDELALADLILEIPRSGQKESLNVSVAFGIAAAQLW